MTKEYNSESMLDVFIFETNSLLEQLEQLVLNSEKQSSYDSAAINEIFRIMHTIKGSSAMMLYNNISSLAHAVEDMFYMLREEENKAMNYSEITDLVLDSIDFIKVEMLKVVNNDAVDGDSSSITEKIRAAVRGMGTTVSSNIHSNEDSIKSQKYYIAPQKESVLEKNNLFKTVLHFEENCGMESIIAFTLMHNLKELSSFLSSFPEDIMENDSSIETVRKEGFTIFIKTIKNTEEVRAFLQQTNFVNEIEFYEISDEIEFNNQINNKKITGETFKVEDEQDLEQQIESSSDPTKTTYVPVTHQSMISVNVNKLDKLMDLVGELVVSEAMVTQNPDLKDLNLENFLKAARHLRKITGELQDMVMSIRMVPLSPTFQKMHRIVRDMCKKLNKEVNLVLIGEDTEVDKNIIEHISDPLMHLIRNSIDHGIEHPDIREGLGKNREGIVTIEAKNAGSDVLIIIRDDGAGLKKEKILGRAVENGLISSDYEWKSDNELYSLILKPGFSTKDTISEFSGRGVGMDVVTKNLEEVGGSISIHSTEGKGTAITLKIPLTLAIIDGMNIRVGKSCYTIPTTSIRQSFRPEVKSIIKDLNGNEVMMVRGIGYSVVRLHDVFKVNTSVTNMEEGIVVMIENDDSSFCLFADELIGEQQVVVKSLPKYLKKVKGLAGCTLLGDGSISLILDTAALNRIKN